MSLVCEGVGVRYEGAAAWALRGASLTLRPGEAVGVVGRSGSGKTTLLRCLAGRLTSAEGSVRLGDDACAQGKGLQLQGGNAASRRAWAQRVCLVDQLPERQLFGKTVYEDVAFGPRNAGLDERAVDARVEEALRAVGFDRGRARRVSPFALSGGEQRRVALAGMLALQAPYLLLDEPTVGLDAQGLALLSRLVDELAAKGTCVVVVSHDVDFLADHVRRLVVLDGGGVVADGPTSEVLSQRTLLEDAGLEVPLAARIAARLRERGVDVGAASTTDALICAVVRAAGAPLKDVAR